MNICCISASNTLQRGAESNSTKVCRIIDDIIKDASPNEHNISILHLLDFNLKSCFFCGNCCNDYHCIYDNDFNMLFNKLISFDLLFLVVPHYSIIPSKLVILMEKLNELSYGSWLLNPQAKFPLNNKPVVILGHGGQIENEDVLKYYHDVLINPLANTLKGLTFNVLGFNDKYTAGIPFGLKDETYFIDNKENIFPDINNDWDYVKDRIAPYIKQVLNNTSL